MKKETETEIKTDTETDKVYRQRQAQTKRQTQSRVLPAFVVCFFVDVEFSLEFFSLVESLLKIN